MMSRAHPRVLFAMTALLTAGAWVTEAAAAGGASFTADPGASHLDFVGVQAGAEFKGTFRKFSAAIDFSPDALPTAHFDVLIDLGSSDTKDKDRDQTMHGADVFDVAHFPTAHYVARSFTKTATGYSAQGALTLHGVTHDVPIDFQFVPTAGGATLTGNATLKRLDFGVGQGDWKSTQWIADAVKVSFSLTLQPKS